MPGVSIRQPPDGSGSRVRKVVVWRPRASFSRTALVFIFSTPSSVLVRVDLPAPDEPTSTAVRPGPSHGSSAATLARSLAFTATATMPCAASSASAASEASASLPSTSALVSTTTGLGEPWAVPPPRTSSR